jgi:predicted MFS family arabinose efflux permease
MGLFDQVRYLPREVKIFVATEAFLGIGMGILGFVLNFHFLALNISPEEIGALNSIGTFVMGLFSLPAGFMARHFGRKRIFITGIVLIGLGYLIFGIGTTLYLFYIAQIIQFIGISLLVSTEIQLLFSYAKETEVETLSYSLLFAVFTLFSGIGTLMGGFIPQLLRYGTTKYQGSIYISALSIFLVAILRGSLLPCLNNNGEDKKGKEERKGLVEGLKEHLNSKIIILTLYLFLMGIVFSLVIPFQNVIIKFTTGWHDEAVSYILTANGIILFFASIIMPWLINELGVIRSYYYVYAINIGLAFILYFKMVPIAFGLIFLLRSGSFTLFLNMVDSQTMSAVEESKRDFFGGARTFLRSIGGAIGSFAAGYMIQRGKSTIVFLITSVILLISFVYFEFLVKPIFIKELEKKGEGM